jgi:hypothetical protein
VHRINSSVCEAMYGSRERGGKGSGKWTEEKREKSEGERESREKDKETENRKERQEARGEVNGGKREEGSEGIRGKGRISPVLQGCSSQQGESLLDLIFQSLYVIISPCPSLLYLFNTCRGACVLSTP